MAALDGKTASPCGATPFLANYGTLKDAGAYPAIEVGNVIQQGSWSLVLRVATVIAAAGATAASGLAAPDARADPQTKDQRFIEMVRKNGVAEGQDESLIKYADEFCTSTTGVVPSRPVLYEQGVRLPAEFYSIKVAASRVYCPDKVVMPPAP